MTHVFQLINLHFTGEEVCIYIINRVFSTPERIIILAIIVTHWDPLRKKMAKTGST